MSLPEVHLCAYMVVIVVGTCQQPDIHDTGRCMYMQM